MFSICFIVFVLSLFDGVFGQAVYSARTGAAKTTISAGEDVTIDENIELSSQLTIEGVLRCAKKHLSVVVPRIIIKGNGKFICGTANERQIHRLTIVLTGAKSNDESIFNSKCIAVIGNGQLDLHGADRSVTWTQLGATARVGSRNITLKESVDWQTGEEIVIASTDFDMNQAEKVTITAVDASKKIISFDKALGFMHFGVVQTFQGGRKLDERAEVGLLTRNIVIRGDNVQAKSRMGGHVIVTDTAQARVDGVELTQMGMTETLGRYCSLHKTWTANQKVEIAHETQKNTTKQRTTTHNKDSGDTRQYFQRVI